MASLKLFYHLYRWPLALSIVVTSLIWYALSDGLVGVRVKPDNSSGCGSAAVGMWAVSAPYRCPPTVRINHNG